MHKRIIPAIALGLLGLGGAAYAQKPTTPPTAGKPSVSLDIKLVAASASSGTFPLKVATASPASGYTLIGGGCAASHVGDDAPPGFAHALIMYGSKPSNDSWQCAAGLPPKLGSFAGRVVAAGIYAQASSTKGKASLDCVVREATSPRGPAPKVNVQLSSTDVDKGYVLTSGSCTGADASQVPYNTVVFSSRPTDDMKGWSCEASGPLSTGDAAALTMATTVTANLVACRLQGPGTLESKLFTGPVNAAAGNIGFYPSAQAQVEPGHALTGGGCAVIATKPLQGLGVVAPEYMVRSLPAFPLTSQTPTLNDTWECKGGDPPFLPNPATAQAFAIGLRVATGEELWVDTRSAAPVLSERVLEKGKPYRVTLQGTFNVWGADIVPGGKSSQPEPAPMFPSANAANRNVGFDPEFVFAWPKDHPMDKSPEPAPRRQGMIELSLDGGKTWKHPATTAAFNATEHRYTYEVTGAGSALQVRMADKPVSDNSGRLWVFLLPGA
ncbi:hypothetical protein [Archangium sp.]|uniref:hypothetical protein n=1 Tax=Archangium sp. TaxID=1872627 RepID=UPI00286B07B4|nr:hypothetical protein [Archangium sp.]